MASKPLLALAASSTFADPHTVSTSPRASNVAMGDFDGDGNPDVAVMDQQSGAVEVHFGNGSGGFTSTVASFTVATSDNSHRGITAADLDGDDHWELVFAAGNEVKIYDWDGSQFSPTKSISLSTTGIDATKVSVGELTAAGSRDIVVSDDYGSVGVVWIPNDAPGHYGSPAAFAAAGCDQYAVPVLADVDGDGLADVILSHQTIINNAVVGSVGVLLNKGDGTLDAEVNYLNSSQPTLQTHGIAFADVDGDGKPDLVTVANVSDQAPPYNNTFYLNVNLNNGNGTFADGVAFRFVHRSGLNIIAEPVIGAADLNGDGRADIVTLTNDGAFLVTQFTGTGVNLMPASEDAFPTQSISYGSITFGYSKNDGTFVTFNNDPQPDLIIGTNFQFGATPPLTSQFLVLQNTTPTIPTGRNVEFTQTNLTVAEGDDIDVTVVRGSDSTGQVLAFFTTGGTATYGEGKTGDYVITDPSEQAQPVIFADGEFEKSIHISTAASKTHEANQTIVLTLIAPVGDADVGTKSTATVTIVDAQGTTLPKPGGLVVKPTNAVKPVPKNLSQNGVSVLGITGSDWTFSISQKLPDDASNARVKVQYSVESPANNQWFDAPFTLTHGKGTAWTATTRHPLPFPCNKLYFRTVTSADGYPDQFGSPTQAFALQFGPELGLYINVSSDSDSSGQTVHEGEVITYNFQATNQNGDADAGPVVITAPVPKHTSYFSSNLINGIAAIETKDKQGNTTAITWTLPTLAKAHDAFGAMLVQVDNADQFSAAEQKKHPHGYGYVLVQTGCSLTALNQGVKAAPLIFNGSHAFGKAENDTLILGSLKVSIARSTDMVAPGGLITYTLTAENDDAQPLTGAIVTNAIPALTELATVYSFDANGNADSTSQPLPNPGAHTTPIAIIYAKADTQASIKVESFFTIPPTVEQAVALMRLLTPVLNSKPGTEVNLSNLDQHTIDVLVDNGFIVPARVQWTMGTIPAKGTPGQSNSRDVSFTVRVPYDQTPIADGSTGRPVVIVNDGYDFFISVPGSNPPQPGVSALYQNPALPLTVSLLNTVPAAVPHLTLAKSARGDLNLNNPDFHGNGYSTLPFHGNVVNVAEPNGVTDANGVDYVLTYRNDLVNGDGADAHGVVIHDVIPLGMQLKGFFKQVIGNPVTSGTLVSGQSYYIENYVAGDDFTNVGAPSNATGVTFTATGTTPTVWTHGTGMNDAPVTMHAEQFTFYDKKGTIIPTFNNDDPNGFFNDMANVASMDIRLGDVSNLTFVPKGTSGFIKYTCVPTITHSTVLKFPNYDFDIAPGVVHAFGGFQPSQGLSGKLQGFYVSTSDLHEPIAGGPFDCVVQVVATVSFSPVTETLSVNDTQPFDVAPIDFTFTQNGDVSVTNAALEFDVPKGTTFLNGAFTPHANAVVTLNPQSHQVANGSSSFDFSPYDTGTALSIPANQSGSHVKLTLPTIAGHTTKTVRVFFQVNGPTLDAAIKAAGYRFEPANVKVSGTYQGVQATKVGRQIVTRAIGTTGIATAGVAVHNGQKAHDLNPPILGITRAAPLVVSKGGTYTVGLDVTNSGDTDATGVQVGMQIPYRTTYQPSQFPGETNGVISTPATVLGQVTTAVSVNPNPPTLAERSALQKKLTGGGPDVITWHLDRLPAHGRCHFGLTLKCEPEFGDEPIQDHSAYVSATNAGGISLAAMELSTWILGKKSIKESSSRIAQAFLENLGFSQTPEISAVVNQLAGTITDISQVHGIGGLDYFQLPASGVKIIPLGQDQVMVFANTIAQGGGNVYPLPGNGSMVIAQGGGNVIAQGGGNAIAQGGGNVIAQGGGNVIAQGGGNAISITGISGFDTPDKQTCAYLLDNIPAVIAQGGGNVIAQGGGNLVSTNGGNLLSNHLGGGLLQAISPIASNVIFADGGRAIAQGGGNLIGHDGGSLIGHDGGSLINQDGASLINMDGAGVTTAVGGGVISHDGGTVISHDGGTFTYPPGGSR